MEGCKVHIIMCKHKLRCKNKGTLYLVSPISRILMWLFQDSPVYSSTFQAWLGGRVLDSRPRGRGFEPHRRHCVIVFEQDTFILA